MDVEDVLDKALDVLFKQADSDKVKNIIVYSEPFEILVIELSGFTMMFGMDALRNEILTESRFTPAMTSEELSESILEKIIYEVESEALGLRPNSISLRVG